MNFWPNNLLYKKRDALRLLRGVACGSLMFLLFTACTGPELQKTVPTQDLALKVDHVPVREETVRGNEDPPVVTLQLGKALHTSTLRPSEQLPSHVKIGNTNLNNVPVTVAMQAVLADTDITLLWEKAELQDRKVTLLNLKGSLPVVVKRICRAAKLLCAYRNGALELMDEDTFVVELPPVPTGGSSSGGGGASDTIVDTIQALVDGKVKVDRTGGNLIYTANADGHERVQTYLEQLRNGRPLIVLQLYIWQVDLNNTQELGINWSQLNFPDIGGKNQDALFNSTSAFQKVATGGVSLGAVFSGAIDATTLVRFLSTQGKVQSISSPQLTFISGTSAKFENGGSQKYVNQVGTLVAGSVSGTTSSTAGVSNNTISTEELKTGITITANGNYQDGVVFAGLEIKTSDLVQFKEIDADGTTLQLPQTNDRTVSTVLRVRPGDNLVLAGLQTSKDTRTRDGLPLGGSNTVPMFSANDVINSETVILVRPSVVFFSDQGAERVAEDSAPEPEEKVKPEISALPVAHPPAPTVAANTIVSPGRHDPMQDDFAAAVRRFQTRPAVPPENIKPNPEVQAP